MEPIYTTQAKEDRAYWQRHNKKMLQRIDRLIEDIKTHPHKGIGKLEPLKFEKSGYWSRRINQEHRLVYKVVDGQIYLAQCRYRY